MATVIAVGVHVALLMVLLRPASGRGDMSLLPYPRADALVLRLIAPPPLTVPVSVPVVVRARAAPRKTTHARRVDASVTPDRLIAPPTVPDLPTQGTDEVSAPDGGFGARLREAEHASGVHGLPGSDRPLVPGVRLTDPMHQGVGALMRKTQRLFGVTNRHCIDVEVWRRLTPDERIARHISSADMDKAEGKYDCNRPLGLGF